MIRIRPLVPVDAAAFLELLLAVDAEAPYMLFSPGERRSNPDRERARINWWRMSANSQILAAEDRGALVGYVMATGGTVARNRHCVTIEGLAVRKAWRRRGVGSGLLARILEWADQSGVRRLELSVLAPNLEALSLYERHGFRREGVKRQASRVGDRYVDHIIMARLAHPAEADLPIDNEKSGTLCKGQETSNPAGT